MNVDITHRNIIMKLTRIKMEYGFDQLSKLIFAPFCYQGVHTRRHAME